MIPLAWVTSLKVRLIDDELALLKSLDDDVDEHEDDEDDGDIFMLCLFLRLAFDLLPVVERCPLFSSLSIACCLGMFMFSGDWGKSNELLLFLVEKLFTLFMLFAW